MAGGAAEDLLGAVGVTVATLLSPRGCDTLTTMRRTVKLADEPAALPSGGSTLARCTRCDAPYVPRTSAHLYCCARCRAQAKQASETGRERQARGWRVNASYRLAARCLRRAGIDPSACAALETLRGRGVVDGWRDVIGLPRRRPGPPSVATAETPPDAPRVDLWAAQCPTPTTATLGTFVALDLRPRPPQSITLRHTRLLHGALSRATGLSHETMRGRWSLVPCDAGCRWGVFLYPDVDPALVTSAPLAVHYAGERATLSATGPRVHIRPPAALPPGRYRVTMETITPASWAREGKTVAVLAPTAATGLSSCETIARKILVSHVGAHVESAEHDVREERVYVGGHISRGTQRRGSVIAVVGTITFVCNAPAAWLLRCAEYTGIGGTTAFGFGRVRVAVEAL